MSYSLINPFINMKEFLHINANTPKEACLEIYKLLSDKISDDIDKITI